MNFRMGREDVGQDSDANEEGLLPGSDSSSLIIHGLELSTAEQVALMGRRTLGKQDRMSQNPYVFDNTYFQELLKDESRFNKLESDLELVSSDEHLQWVKKFAKDEELFFETFAQAFVKLSEAGSEDELLSEV